MSVSRKEFLKGALVLSSGLVVGSVLPACGDETNNNNNDAGTDAGQLTCDDGAGATSISGNHGHTVANLSKTDLETSGTVTVDLSEALSHTHSFELTDSHKATLLGGGSVSIETVDDASGHNHTVTLRCVS